MVYDMCMSDDLELDGGGYPTTTKKKTKSAIGSTWYGDGFENFMKVGEVRHHLTAFKDLYYLRKLANLGVTTKAVLVEFNASITPEKFNPYPAQVKLGITKWERDILEQLNFKKAEMVKRGDVMQVIKTRASDTALAYDVPEDQALEAGVRTLAGELLNDGFKMLRDDQALDEVYTNDELIKRRNYVLNVLGHTTRMVQGKAALMLKASQEKRETASFLMDLMREAAAGKLSPDKLGILKTTMVVAPVVHEHVESHAG